MPVSKADEAKPTIYVAKTSFAVTLTDEPIMVKKGDLVDAKDPLLKGREELFEPFVPQVRPYKTRGS